MPEVAPAIPLPPAASAPERGAADAALLAACRLVGAALGAVIAPPGPAPSTAVPRDRLADIARASGLRTRQVLLRGDWWRQAHGPLLGYWDADHAAVALLPRGRRGYVVVDPRFGQPVAVTPDVAAKLSAFAVMLYRSLPPRPLGVSDILRFGLGGSAADLWNALAAGVVRAGLALALPIAAAVMFDTLLPTARIATVWLVGGGVLAAALAALTLELAQRIALLRVGQRMSAALDAAVWDRLISLPIGVVRKYGAGDLAALADGVGSLAHAVVRSAVDVALALVGALASSAIIAWFAPQLAPLVLGVLLATALSAVLLARVQHRSARRAGAWRGHLHTLVLQAIGGIVRIRVSGAERRVLARWRAAQRTQQAEVQRAGVVGRTQVVWDTLAPLMALMALLGAAVLGDVALAPGALAAALLGLGMLSAAAAIIAVAAAALMQNLGALRRSMPLLQAPPEADVRRAHPGVLAGGIALHDVSFRYHAGGPLILDRVSLTIAPGEFVALVGASGSGKSTLLRLLLGFEQPAAGVVAYDGQDLSRLDVREVRQQLGVVLQHGALMADDLFHNIVGATTLGLDDAWEAARMAGLADEIAQLPMGMHTMVPENGSTFSGGQRQRLLIARALVRRPRILLFDEATSALDNATQATVSASLEQLRVTRIVIAHRLSTIRSADRIYVLDHGRIVESGTYAALLSANGVFAQLARRQII